MSNYILCVSMCKAIVFSNSGMCLELCGAVFFFFFKQKTAYEMRISDWSSDVCSSDLAWGTLTRAGIPSQMGPAGNFLPGFESNQTSPRQRIEIGRASCRERVCQYV